ncbi:MAG: virulence RhuM family protein [Clostridia bacterium]|nr:virulence RhuM family protein [Clostridia bacterium]
MNRQKQTPSLIRSSAAEVLTYVASTGDPQDSIEIRYEDENIWLTQKTMAQLYDVSVSTINGHIKKIFADSELQEDAVIRKFRITAADQKNYNTNHYSLQMIIAVGFKVNSERAVQFRKWVNQIASQYTIRGWVMDDERLKQGTYLTDKYFDEQLERIREIRASERKFYQKVTDLYATAVDYDRSAAATKRFYATVQNKMHFAVHGHTAAELIMARADHTREHMGLTTWQDAPDGKIKKSDVTIAKNYLTEFELGQLSRMVTSYLDFAENMAQRHIPLTMQDWETRLNRFIEMFEYGLLKDAGRVFAEIAKLHAETEFEKYRVIQDRLFLSDYDRFLLELEAEAGSIKD